jgi:hypothetical protein
VECVSARLVPELGIPYENGASVALGVKGFVAATIDGVGPLCDKVAAGAMVVLTDDDKLGDASSVVATMMGMEEIPEEVAASVVIAVCGADRSLVNRTGTITSVQISVFEVSTNPILAVDSSGGCSGSKAPVALKYP